MSLIMKNSSASKITVSPSDAMQVNTVKALEDSDFIYVKQICDNHNDWDLTYEKKLTKVWIKPANNVEQSENNVEICASKFRMIKVRSVFKDVSADVVYDVLQDSSFRKKWDKYMISTVPIGYINPNNDICYYSCSFPPFRSRDFVMQRSWLDMNTEKFICGHSVCHDRFPPTKTHIRGLIYLTVYFVRQLDEGCELTYLTHSDPKGKLPSWLMNNLTKIVAPRLVKKLHKACRLYVEWKKNHNPSEKSWLYPETLNYPRINLNDCQPKYYAEETIIDESLNTEHSNI